MSKKQAAVPTLEQQRFGRELSQEERMAALVGAPADEATVGPIEPPTPPTSTEPVAYQWDVCLAPYPRERLWAYTAEEAIRVYRVHLGLYRLDLRPTATRVASGE